MNTFVDPRTSPVPKSDHPVARRTADGESLARLHDLCRQGRLYDVERWIAEGGALQLSAVPRVNHRRASTALEIAIERKNYSLVLLLLCNGYDPNHEPQCTLNLALETRRLDFVELLLEWGGDPHLVDREKLFDSYDRAVFERFYQEGVDLTVGHALAAALGYSSRNKPLFGFAKKYQSADSKIRRDLNMALGEHAYRNSERGVMLCLWAGADPHAKVPCLRYYDEEDAWPEEEDAIYGGTAVSRACLGGHAKLLALFRPDPTIDDFQELYYSAPNPAVVEVLGEYAAPGEMLEIVKWRIAMSRWVSERRDSIGALRRMFELGGQWRQASPQDIAELRRRLLQAHEEIFKDVVDLLGTADYCSSEIRRELARTPGFQKKMQKVGMMPEKGDRGWYHRRDARRYKELLAAYGLW